MSDRDQISASGSTSGLKAGDWRPLKQLWNHTSELHNHTYEWGRFDVDFNIFHLFSLCPASVSLDVSLFLLSLKRGQRGSSFICTLLFSCLSASLTRFPSHVLLFSAQPRGTQTHVQLGLKAKLFCKQRNSNWRAKEKLTDMFVFLPEWSVLMSVLTGGRRREEGRDGWEAGVSTCGMKISWTTWHERRRKRRKTRLKTAAWASLWGCFSSVGWRIEIQHFFTSGSDKIKGHSFT